jgi:hypothetical protein
MDAITAEANQSRCNFSRNFSEQQQMVSNTAISNNTDAITAEVFSQSG